MVHSAALNKSPPSNAFTISSQKPIRVITNPPETWCLIISGTGCSAGHPPAHLHREGLSGHEAPSRHGGTPLNSGQMRDCREAEACFLSSGGRVPTRRGAARSGWGTEATDFIRIRRLPRIRLSCHILDVLDAVSLVTSGKISISLQTRPQFCVRARSDLLCVCCCVDL